METEKLNEVMPLIAKVVDGESLTAKESENVFTNIFLHDSEGYHFSTFISALHAKGETPDELLGLCMTHKNMGLTLKPKVSDSRLTDLSGSGGGVIKTFNVSTTASFIVSAVGYVVAKQAFWGVTSPTGSADVFAAMGINISELKGEQIERALERVRLCPFYLPAISPKLKNRGKVSKSVYIDKGIKIKTPFHLVSNAYSAIPMKRRIYGIYSERYLEVLAKLFFKLGYQRTLTIYGEGGLPEMSNVGKTTIVEQNGSKIKRHIIKPKDLGVKRVEQKKIMTGGKEQNIVDFLRILLGKQKGPKRDLALINAAASLYVLGETNTIIDAVPLARYALESGEAFRVLERLVAEVGDLKRLKGWMKKT